MDTECQDYQKSVEEAYLKSTPLQVRSRTADKNVKWGRSWHNLTCPPVWNWKYYEYRVASDEGEVW